jgi:hypothetical protein
MARKMDSVADDEGVSHPDFLRTLETICRPDPRNESSDSPKEHGSGRTLEAHHANVAALTLNEAVPEKIRIQFETTKNLYLYAWFVYRFYPVAELHAHTCLELALKTRFAADFPGNPKRPHGPGLRKLLAYAIKTGVLKNENFDVWRRTTAQRTRSRALAELIEEMERLNLDEAEFDEASVVANDADRNHDYVGVLVENLPEIRNEYGHGSTALHNQVIGSVRIVQEVINQLWPD